MKATGTMRFKINAVIVITCIFTAMVWIAVFAPFEKKRRQTRLQNIRILMETIYEQKKEDLANEIFANQQTAIRLTLEKIQKVDGVSRLAVFDLEGRLLVTTLFDGEETISAAEKQQLESGPLFQRATRGDRTFAVFTTIVEVVGERVGYFVMDYDLQAMQHESLLTLVSFLTLVLLTMMLTLLLLNRFLGHTVIRPTTKLRHAIVRLRSGEWGEQVAIDSQDEIGEVAQAFNEMSLRLSEQHGNLTRAVMEKDDYAGQLEATNQALADLNARLEEMVAARTAELLARNDQLKLEIRERQLAEQAKKELQRRLTQSQKMEALGLLAGGVAHDLNNVLSGMVSYPDLLLMDMPDDHALRQPIETIRASGQKASAIVQDLLTLARRGVVNQVVLNFNQAVVGDYLESPEYQKLLSFHSHVVVQTQLAADLMNIKGSAVHLRKTLMNLVANAAEAQPDGGTITITTRNQVVNDAFQASLPVKAGEYVVLQVSDQGSGIEPDDLSRIFEPFYTKKVMGRSGTGLGMAVVWGTVQDHQGHIDVRSTPGQGTVFSLYFPATREALPRAAGTTPLQSYVGAGETVLVVDDVPEQRQIAVNILGRLNYAADAVSSGEAAVAYLQRQPVDILVLDMIMDPGMDGLETYIRILEFNPGQKAIIASGYAENERVKKARELGAGAYIKKPYTVANLGQTLHAVLNRSAQRSYPI